MSDNKITNYALWQIDHFNQLVFDLFVTALEGGIGYWSECSEYHWMGDDGGDDLNNFYAVIHDMEDDKVYRIDRSVIVRGYNLAVSGKWRDRISWSSEKPPVVPTEDGWDMDAGDADVIVQLGLFDRLIYG